MFEAGVEQKFRLAIDRNDIAADMSIDHPVLPPVAAGNGGQRGGAKIGRNHRPAEIGLTLRRIALIADAELFTDDAVAAVATSQIEAADGLASPGTDVLDHRRDAVLVFTPVNALPAVPVFDQFTRLHMLEQHGLGMHLIAAENRLDDLIDDRSRGPGVKFLVFGRHFNPRELEARQRGEVNDVGTQVARKSDPANSLNDAEAPVMLHRPRVLRTAFGMPARARLAIDQNAARAERGEIERQNHAHGTAADDDNTRCAGVVGHRAQCFGPDDCVALALARNNRGRRILERNQAGACPRPRSSKLKWIPGSVLADGPGMTPARSAESISIDLELALLDDLLPHRGFVLDEGLELGR